MTDDQIGVEARRVIRHEAGVLNALAHRLDIEAFTDVLEFIDECQEGPGTVLVSGVGKSAIAARRIAATLNLVNVAARFLCPVEAVHGGIGGVTRNDLLIAISRGGETGELLRFVREASGLGLCVVSITANSKSTLAEWSSIVLSHPVQEACTFGLMPTSTVTAAGALGDALALTYQKITGQSEQDFAAVHEAGTLGRRLTLKVQDVMVPREEVGTVNVRHPFLHILIALAQYRGTLVVVGEEEKAWVGVITAGDVARWGQENMELLTMIAKDIMTKEYQSTTPDAPAISALHEMQSRGIMAMPVFTGTRELVGMIHLHDVLRAGVL